MGWLKERRRRSVAVEEVPTFSWHGYEIPLDLLHMTGGGPDTFDEISRLHIDQLQEFGPFDSTSRVFEIGCGIGRDAIPFSEILSPPGHYIGTEIIKPSIEWCQANITPRAPHCVFHHFDVDDALHNPGGGTANTDVRLPAEDGSIDRIIGHSVFTHMFEAEIVHYLSEFRRMLAPGGVAMMSFFVTDAEILDEPRHPLAAHLIDQPYDTEGTFIHDAGNPRGAVAFSSEKVRAMAAAAPMTVRSINHGNWSGRRTDVHPLCGQDVVVFTVD